MAAHSSRHSRFATAIRVDAELKWDVGAVVAGDERAGCVLQELGSHAAVFNPGFGIGVDRETVEAAGRVEDGASTVSSRRKTCRHAASIPHVSLFVPFRLELAHGTAVQVEQIR